MAILRLTDGKTVEVKHQTALKLWNILNGNAEPENEREEQVALKVKKIYLNWRNAPDDYIKERFDLIAPMVLSNWEVEGVAAANHQHSSMGLITRPRPGDTFTIEFCKKWGLLKNGKATELAKQYVLCK